MPNAVLGFKNHYTDLNSKIALVAQAMKLEHSLKDEKILLWHKILLLLKPLKIIYTLLLRPIMFLPKQSHPQQAY